MFDKIPESNVLMNSYGIVVPQNQSVSKWHKGRHWKKVFLRRLENGYPRMLFASITLQGAGLSSVNFVNTPFSISKGRFLLFNPLLNAGGRLHRWLTWRLVKVSGKLQIISYPYIHSLARAILFPSLFLSISLIHNSGCNELIKFRFKKSKILNSQQTWI